ncbi:MAG: RpiB/LacA/LacB family sugar-phosphate isomerase [Spirochaetales bacterium]|nr:RpiB/LacA/LacB family sugar-phosphate isomerase [Spirochaetales bacterium]
MNIAVVSETSAGDRNEDIVRALSERGHNIINLGMTGKGGDYELSYIHTGFLSALAVHSGTADFVVGGCGTGQGYLTSVMQYPGMFCGHILSPLDAWLFAQINGGNCLSLALNQGYGWASGENLGFIFDRLFSVEFGAGYPGHRREPQRVSRQILTDISAATHLSMKEIIGRLPGEILRHAVLFPGAAEKMNLSLSFSDSDEKIRDILVSAVEK